MKRIYIGAMGIHYEVWANFRKIVLCGLSVIREGNLYGRDLSYRLMDFVVIWHME